MKTNIEMRLAFTLWLGVILSWDVASQSSLPLLRTDIFWELRSISYKSIQGNIDAYHSQFFFESDSLYDFKGKKYLRSNTDEFFREDTTQGLVYQLNSKDSSEFILFDWNIKVGDSIIGLENSGYDTCYQIVKSIEQITLAGKKRKKSI